jgi:hypothetical protein
MLRRRKRQIRKVAKWLGAALCVLVVLAWVSSRWVEFVFLPWIGGARLQVAFVVGTVQVGVEQPEPTGTMTGTLATEFDRWPVWSFVVIEPEDRHWFWWFEEDSVDGWGWSGVFVAIPLWVVWVAIGVPTALLWHRDRRYRFGPGHCPNCGYSLAGLAAGAACPECGVVRAPQP